MKNTKKGISFITMAVVLSMLLSLTSCAANVSYFDLPQSTRQDRESIAAASAQTLSAFMAADSGAGTDALSVDIMNFQRMADNTIIFNILHMSNADHLFHQGLLLFQEDLYYRSGGRMIAEIHPNSPGDVTLIDMVNVGQADAALITILGAWGGLSELANFESLPYVFLNYEDAWAAYEGTLGEWASRNIIEPYGARAIGFMTSGLRHFTNSVRPINTPEDMAGLIMRSPQNATHVAVYSQFGAASMAMPFGQLRDALRDGLADGQDNPIGQIHGGRLYEVQQYMTISNHMFSTMPLVVSNDFWNALTPIERQTLMESGAAASRAQGELMVAEGQRMLEEIRQSGTQIIEPNLTPFIEAVYPIWEDHMERYGNEFATIASRYIRNPNSLAHRFAD